MDALDLAGDLLGLFIIDPWLGGLSKERGGNAKGSAKGEAGESICDAFVCPHGVVLERE